MARLVSDFIRSDQSELLLDLVGREAARSAGKSLQCLVGRKESDFAQDLTARGRPFRCIQRPAPPTSKDGRQGYQAGLIHTNVSVAQMKMLT